MTNKTLKVLAATAIFATVATSASAFTFTGEKQEMPLSSTAIPHWEVATIQPGDTLSRYCDAWVSSVPIPGIISADCQVTIGGINGIANLNVIHAGSTIILPSMDNDVATIVARGEERGQLQSLAGNPLALAEGMLQLRDRISQLEEGGLSADDVDTAVSNALDGRGFVSGSQLEALREEVKSAMADTMSRAEIEAVIAQAFEELNVPESTARAATAAIDAEVVNAINARLDALEGEQQRQGGEITALRTDVNDLAAQVGEKVTRTEVDTAVQTAVDEVTSGLETRVSNLETKVSGLEARPDVVAENSRWVWVALSVLALVVSGFVLGYFLWWRKRDRKAVATTAEKVDALTQDHATTLAKVTQVQKEQVALTERVVAVEETLPQVKADDLETAISLALKELEEKGVASIKVGVDGHEYSVGLKDADDGKVSVIGVRNQREPVKVENLKKVLVRAAQAGRLEGVTVPFSLHAAE